MMTFEAMDVKVDSKFEAVDRRFDAVHSRLAELERKVSA